MGTPRTRRFNRPPRVLAVALLAFGVWGVSPPWVGPWLGLGVAGVPADVEAVTHAVPGVIVLAVTVAALTWRLPLPAALASTLAGLWMSATHLPLIGQGVQGMVAMDAALFHTLPGVAVLALSVVGAVWAWRAEDRAAVQSDKALAAGRRTAR